MAPDSGDARAVSREPVFVTAETLETLFARYRSTRRPEPLGELFDRASPRLLAVALHLCAHPADAEDALQATFVAAIDAAARWDARRPVLPWLLGILTKQCRRLPERRARRRERELPEEPLVLDDGSPVTSSERRELVARVREHVEALPVEQRQVVLLQLEHGLAPAEIADVLGVAPGTVRMRLHRAVQALRGVLPATLVAAVLAALPSRGIAAVRAAVVGHGLAAAAAGGGLVAGKTLLAAAALLVLLLGAVAIVAPWNAARDVVPQPPSHGVHAETATRSPIAPADGAGATAGRHEALLAAAVGEPPADAAAWGTLCVRVVHAATRAPVEGMPLRVYRAVSDREPRFDVVAAITGADGVARAERVEPGAVRVGNALGAGSASAVVVAGATTTVEIPVPPEALAPFALRGRVRHADGRPAAGATVVVGPRYEAYAVPVAIAAADGRFALAVPGPLLAVGARLQGFAPAPMAFVSPGDTDVELVLAGPAAVALGAVVDAASGEAIPGACIEIGAPRRGGSREVGGRTFEPAPPRIVQSDHDGRFVVEDLPAGDVHVHVRADGRAPFHRYVTLTAGAATDVVCAMVAGATLRGRVVDAAGAPVANASVRLAAAERRWTDADGRFGYRHVRTGRVQLQISGDDVVTRFVERDAVPTDEWTIEVERAVAYRLRFVDASQRPLCGWKVRIESRHEREAVTDGDGCVQLPAFGSGPMRLWLGSPDALDATVPCPWPAAVPGVPCTVVVDEALRGTGTVRGTLVDTTGQPLPSLWLTVRDPHGRWLRQQPSPACFDLDGVPAGEWVLSVHLEQGGCRVARFVVEALRAGERRELGRLVVPRPGRVRASVVRAGGGDVTDASVFVHDAWGNETHVTPRSGEHLLAPGRYTWSAMAEDALWQQGTLDVQPDATTSLELVLQPGARRVVRFPVPVPGWGAPVLVRYVLRAPDGAVYRDGSFDPREDLPYGFVPTLAPGTWRVELTTDDGRRFGGSFVVADLAPSREPIEVAVAPVR